MHHRPPGWGSHRPAYTRRPHVWGGRHFYTYHHFYAFPYRPYSFGPAWHPLGFFLNVVAATATIIAINNIEYRYDAGVFYAPANNGYQVVAPPIGAIVPSLPPDNVPVQVDGDATYYYFGGTFYLPIANGYQVVRAPAGAIVYNLPNGCAQIQAGDITYLQYNGDYYQPIQFNGQPAYEVVDMEQ